MSPALAESEVIGILRQKGELYGGSVVETVVAVAEDFLNGRDVSRGYAGNVRRTARKMAAAGITPANICAQRVHEWVSSLRASPVTKKSELRTALTLWRHGVEVGSIAHPVRGVQKIRCPRQVVRAFTRDQITALVNRFRNPDISREIGTFRNSGCPRALWLEAWTRLAYETALRFGDCYALRAESIVPGGVAVIASKTGQPVVRRISPRTSELLEQLASMSPDGTVFAWAVSRRWALANIRKEYSAAGLTVGRSQWLRRSAATHAEMVERGAGSKVLGHKTAGMDAHYLDHTQLLDRMPSAPLLD
jgi:integrase